jgi:hypothetical protein
MATTLPPAPSSTVSIWEDFVDIFTSPSEVFLRRIGGSPWVPMGVLVVLAGILYFATRGLMQPIMDAEFARGAARAMASNPQVTAEQMEQGRAMMTKIIPVFVLLSVPISIGFVGIILWLVGKMFGATESVGDAMVIATYAWIPRVISFLVAAVIALMTDPAKLNSMFSVTLSAGKLLDPEATQHQLFMMAGRVDVFILWQTALLGIGLSVMGKIPRAQAFLAAGIMWLVGSGIATVMQR